MQGNEPQTPGPVAESFLSPISVVGKGSSIAARVHGVLRKAIVSMQLKPGHSLSEADIARQLGTSRQPVREAFIKLADTGFVEILPQKGTRVLKISSNDVANARYLRQVVEVAIARRAAELLEAKIPANILENLAAQEWAATGDDQGRFIRLDDEFHQMVCIAAGFGTAWRLVEDLKGQMDRVRFLSIPEATPMRRLFEQHSAIVEGIMSGDADSAGQAMFDHLSEMLISMPILVQRHPELFAD